MTCKDCAKAEADLARVTEERDRHSRAADKWCNLYADKCEEIESVQAKADRYVALRGAVVTDPSILRMAAADIEAQGTGFGGLPRSLPVTLRGLADALDRADRIEREGGAS